MHRRKRSQCSFVSGLSTVLYQIRAEIALSSSVLVIHIVDTAVCMHFDGLPMVERAPPRRSSGVGLRKMRSQPRASAQLGAKLGHRQRLQSRGAPIDGSVAEGRSRDPPFVVRFALLPRLRPRALLLRLRRARRSLCNPPRGGQREGGCRVGAEERRRGRRHGAYPRRGGRRGGGGGHSHAKAAAVARAQADAMAERMRWSRDSPAARAARRSRSAAAAASRAAAAASAAHCAARSPAALGGALGGGSRHATTRRAPPSPAAGAASGDAHTATATHSATHAGGPPSLCTPFCAPSSRAPGAPGSSPPASDTRRRG